MTVVPGCNATRGQAWNRTGGRSRAFVAGTLSLIGIKFPRSHHYSLVLLQAGRAWRTVRVINGWARPAEWLLVALAGTWWKNWVMNMAAQRIRRQAAQNLER